MSFAAMLASEPRYRLLVLAIASGMLAVLVQIAVIVGQRMRSTRDARNLLRAAPLEEGLTEAALDADKRTAWTASAQRLSPMTQRVILLPFLEGTLGATRDAAVDIYRDLGLHARDVKQLRSVFWARRVRAMARLSLVARPDDTMTVLAHASDHHLVRILGALVVSRIGTGDDVFTMLADLSLPNRLLEQPIAGIFQRMPPDVFARVVDRYGSLADPSMQRLVLVTAARILPHRCAELVREALRDSAVEVRIGACRAAAQLGAAVAASDLLPVLHDEDQDVRAQAASALGATGDASSVEPLVAALEDRCFWVRQNAARSLGRLGPAALAKLDEISKGTGFAADVARESLEQRALAASVVSAR